MPVDTGGANAPSSGSSRAPKPKWADASEFVVKIEGAGSGTMISLRPERVVVNPDADKYPNRLSAKVEELI